MDFYNKETGEVTAEVIYVPCYGGIPFVTLLHGTDDHFATVFSDIRKLHDFMRDFCRQLHTPNNYTVMGIHHIARYCEAHFMNRVRMMVDPIIVSPQHTRYNEIVKREGKLYMRGEE